MNFIIEYTVKSNTGEILRSGKMRAKNRINSFDAQCKFEEYLKQKYTNFGMLIVHSCVKESITSLLDMLGDDNPFIDLFGKDNPFL